MTRNPECPHEHFDMMQPMGNGYIRCSDCGKGIPIERAMLSLDRRITVLEEFMGASIDNWRNDVVDETPDSNTE